MLKTAALPTFALAALVAVLFCSGCTAREGASEISREHAVELARQHLTFTAKETEAVTATVQGRPVWRVTFRGDPPSASQLGEVLIVTLDRHSGQLVTIAMS